MKALTVHKQKSFSTRSRHYRLPAPVYPTPRGTETATEHVPPRVHVTLAAGFMSTLADKSAAWLRRLKGSAGRIEHTTLPPTTLRQPAREISDILLLRGF